VDKIYNHNYSIDLSDRDAVVSIFTELRPDYVVHLASTKNRKSELVDFSESYNQNLLTSLNVINACCHLPELKRLIFIGSCDEYGLVSTPYHETQRGIPTNAYGLSKLAITQILSGLFHSHRFPSVVLRPSVIYGPHQGSEMFLSALILSLVAGNDFAMTAGDQYRDFVYVDDVVSAIIQALNADEKVNGKVFNIGSGIAWQVKDVASLVAKKMGQSSIEHIKFGAVPYRPNEVMDYAVDITQARSVLNWQPATSLESGLQETIKYFQFSMTRKV
jgi:nucleoside-diphosphate-sugar epimerase